MIILGLAIPVAAVVIGVARVLSNSGSALDFTGGFSVLGVDVTGSAGTLFLYGIVVGAAALFGLILILTGTRHATRRGRTARGRLKHEHGSARAQTAQAEGADEDPAGLVEGPRHEDHWFRHRAAH
ncbi:hypothetical protein AB5J55_29490 [Streptomyces sp. R11]|uniref:Integral membrane protein n=1 Tax=Streptomyces sp. R11 TaxID=3238625 RepID=A0AB39N4S9_9ACTN